MDEIKNPAQQEEGKIQNETIHSGMNASLEANEYDDDEKLIKESIIGIIKS